MDALAPFHPAVRAWFSRAFEQPTKAQALAWPAIARGESVLLLAPTGSGKTLAAFLAAIDRLSFSPPPKDPRARCRVLYVSPLKALAVDVERNLRAPLAGIAHAAEMDRAATRGGVAASELHRVEVDVRSGDTPAKERARMLRAPGDILVTTPESLYLLLTSRSREVLRAIDVVILDEIHALVPTKRGAHLALSLERLEALRVASAGVDGAGAERPPLQRIGLSATQRPLEEVARFLGGGRPVTIVDGSTDKHLELRVEVTVDDLSRLGADDPDADPGKREDRSIWPRIHPRLLELIRAHRSTILFANSRRLAERLAGALNDLAGEELALAHHGSLSKERRADVEDRLKRGQLPAIVATSSLELGIDMGAVDLVVQVEPPPSVAAGLQRIGRANHHVGGTSEGVVFPKHRGELPACAAGVAEMLARRVERSTYPRNPLDVLAQQLVASCAAEASPVPVDTLYDRVRGAAPFADLPRASFDAVLDMLSGRYPSDEFAELRPRLHWDRLGGTVRAREGALRLAVTNGGTIADRGLYPVFLAGGADDGTSKRVGELDEEMVFESREGDVFLLGASAWRIAEITHDRVLVVPAPGEPGRMPFWRGDRVGRPVDFGRAIGALLGRLAALDPAEATALLEREHRFDARAAKNLVAYVEEQREAAAVPTDTTVVVERFVDELGDHRVCVLSPLGARVLGPWAIAVAARIAAETGVEVDHLWSDDGMVFRIPERDRPPDAAWFVPGPDEIESLVVGSLGDTALFAGRFREAAGRALLLPRRNPGRRTPLWAQRKRANDLLAVASRHRDFPIVLEAYRECLREAFDLPALVEVLRAIEQRAVRVRTVDTPRPSPFSSTLLFSWVGSFLYDGDQPLAERRAQALAIDHGQLRALLGEAELRELLDQEAIEDHERTLQRLPRLDGTYARPPVETEDQLHELLLALGDLDELEIAARSAPPPPRPEGGTEASVLAALVRDRRVVLVRVAGVVRAIAAEDAARYRDALGIALPGGLPQAFLEPVEAPLDDLVRRFARTHGPFPLERLASRLGVGVASLEPVVDRLVREGRLVVGEMLRGGRGREVCDAEVLRALRRRSLAKLRKEVEPVDQAALARFLPVWHGVSTDAAARTPARSERRWDVLWAAIDKLAGCPLPASVLEREILPARAPDHRPEDLDALCAAGELVWVGIEPLGETDGRIALYRAEDEPLLAPRPVAKTEGELAGRVRAALEERGAQFFSELLRRLGVFPPDLLDTLWTMVWNGEVVNDTLAPLRARRDEAGARRGRDVRRPVPGRLGGPPGSEGRWSLRAARLDFDQGPGGGVTETARRTALVRKLLERHGIVTREALEIEAVEGGFSALYDVLRALEESGRVRRGLFVAGLSASQFAVAGADERLRALRDPTASGEAAPLVLAATDPANPFGAVLDWPAPANGPRVARAAGALVVLADGALLGYLARGEQALSTFAAPEDPRLARALGALVDRGPRKVLLLSTIDGAPALASPHAAAFRSEGFVPGAQGLLRKRRFDPPVMPPGARGGPRGAGGGPRPH